MPEPHWADPQVRRAAALDCFTAALAAAEPRAAVRAAVQRTGDVLTTGGRSYDLSAYRRIVVIGAGKAGSAMTQELEALLGDRIAAGIVVVKRGGAQPVPRIRIIEAAHPVPDEAGVQAGHALLELVRSASNNDLILCVLSGGGSALLVAPAGDITLTDQQAMTDLLLRAGCTINEINTVRKHCSLIKGGRLAEAANGATLITLILSDVVGSPLDVIASGPTVPDPTTYADALAVLDRYALRHQIPARVMAHLEAGQRGELPETPKPGSPVFSRSQYVLVGSVGQVCERAAVTATQMGLHPLILTTFLQGEAREVARVLVATAREVEINGRPVPRPACLIAGGETTVLVHGDGLGGRCQELALASALGISGHAGTTIAALATDGGDGPTDAAGAIVDELTVGEAARHGVDCALALTNNDAYHALAAAGSLVRTGPTGTNVNDLVLAIVA